MTDNHIYRRYTCNIEAPYIKCKQLIQTSPASTLFQTYEGYDGLATVHTITSSQLPILSGKDWTGEFNCYLSNNPNLPRRQQIIMTVIQNITGNPTTIVVYQTIGNLVSSSVTTNSTITSTGNLIITTSPATVLRWSFKGT